MSDIFNKDFWISQWENDRENDTYSVHKGFSTPEYWDQTAATYNKSKKEIRNKRIQKTLNFFEHAGMEFKGMSVLDIGCGTGLMGIALAERGAKITALDFSSKMLERFQEEISGAIKKQVSLRQVDWHDIDIEKEGWVKGFDLVMAFMSPGVATPRDLNKMMACSKKYCAIRGWASKKAHPILAGLWKKIMDAPLTDKPQSFLYKINLLFALGYFPDIQFDTITWENDNPVEDELETQVTFFKKVCKLSDEELKRIILPYLLKQTENKRIVRKHKGLAGTAVWTI